MAPRRVPRRADSTRSALALGIAIVFLTTVGAVGAGPSYAQPPSPHSSSPIPGSLAPALRIGALRPAAPRPEASNAFYTQIGATLAEINNTFAIDGLSQLSEEIPLVTSPYPVGYELNLLSNTGDWYQVVVGDSWPGCNSGFEELYEIWNSHGSSGPPTCDATVALAKGNLVELNASLPSQSTACLGVDDLSTHHDHVLCSTQPDTGASQFIFLGTAANGNGYYTGTMTEILNQSATSCPDYRYIPTVTFDFPSWAHITEYVPWSDEWNAVPSGAFCASNDGPVVYLAGSAPESHYEDATSGASDGPQEVQGQNDTVLNASVGFRFQSDPKEITSETLNATATNVLPGGVVTLQSSISGGVGPYGTVWEYDGGFGSGQTGTEWNYSAFTAGNYTFVAFGTDGQGDALGSPTITIHVPSPLRTGPLNASTGPGADVLQLVNFSARVTGGLLPLTFTWSDLPTGCTPANRSWVICAPSTTGNWSIVLTTTDSNGSEVQTPALPFEVSPRLGIGLSASRSVADLGQTAFFQAIPVGGSGDLSFVWGDLPAGCGSVTAFANCTLSAIGESIVTVSVTDSNRASVTSDSVILVANPDLSGKITASPTLVDVGRTLTLRAKVTGGSGDDLYQWSGLPPGCTTSDLAALPCTPEMSSTYSVGLTVLDAANASLIASPIEIVVDPVLSLSLSANVSDPIAPAFVSITPTVQGGSSLENVSWTQYPAGCVASGIQPAECQDLGVGNYTISLRVDDAGLGNATATLHLDVRAPAPHSSGSGPGGVNEEELLLGLLALVVIAVGVAVALAGRSRPRQGP